METLIDHHQLRKRRRNANDNIESFLPENVSKSLIQLPGFNSLDPNRKQAIQSKFLEILERPTSCSGLKGAHLDEL
jgi:hypothetical protein